MIIDNETTKQIDFLANSLNEFKKKKFIHKKITYVESTIRETESNLNYLLSIDIVDNSLILGFCEDVNYLPKDTPRIYKKNKKGITYRGIESKDEGKMNFLWIDFEVNHLLFVDRLIDGIVIFKTNARVEIETMILRKRFIFREEIRCIDIDK